VSAARLGRWRRAVQAAVALAYLALPFLGWERVAGTLSALRLGPVDLLEPAAAASAVLAARFLSWTLLLGALPAVLLALALGSVYCSWLCPFGLLSEGIDRLRAGRRRWPERSWVAMRAPRLVALLLLAGGALALRSPLGAVLSPPRLATALPLEAWSGRGVPWVTGGLLLGFLAVELLGPRRIVCRALCPAGGLAALLRTRRTWRPRLEEARCRCPDLPSCHLRCPWGLDPRRMEARDGCTSCLACVEHCPTGALTVLRRRGDPR
jgi:ferredoxin-type protein NapH